MSNVNGMLMTLGWTHLENRKTLEELCIPLCNVVFLQKHDDGTCLVSVSERRAVLVDQTLKQMRQILKEAKKDPNKDFFTHDGLE